MSENCSELENKIIRQVEYYFGDANLNRDKFLLEQIRKNEGGWVPLSVLLTFKRLSALSTSSEEIVNSIKKSDSGLLEVNEVGDQIRRHPERPIPEHNEERRKDIVSRTAYAKGFPLDSDINELLDFFSSYNKVVNLNMRKYLDKPSKTYKFKGSVFVTFETVEQANDFLEKDKVVFKERELLRKWQENYLNEKKEEQKSKKSKAKPADEEKLVLPKGAVVFFDGATNTVTREMLREATERICDLAIAYIDYSKGDASGHIRFQEENSSKEFFKKLDDKKLILGEEGLSVNVHTLTEEEEASFLNKAIEHMKSRRSQHKSKGHHGNRKRRGLNDRNDSKKIKSS